MKWKVDIHLKLCERRRQRRTARHRLRERKLEFFQKKRKHNISTWLYNTRWYMASELGIGMGMGTRDVSKSTSFSARNISNPRRERHARPAYHPQRGHTKSIGTIFQALSDVNRAFLRCRVFHKRRYTPKARNITLRIIHLMVAWGEFLLLGPGHESRRARKKTRRRCDNVHTMPLSQSYCSNPSLLYFHFFFLSLFYFLSDLYSSENGRDKTIKQVRNSKQSQSLQWLLL